MTEDSKLTVKDLTALYENGFISLQDLLKGTERGGSAWRDWAARNLLFFGAALLLSAVICFFAFNWDKLGNILKLSIPAGLFILLGAGAVWRGLDTLQGKVLSISAAVMIGVFMASFGQVYQTGADAWQLFAGWSVLMLPLVVLTNTTGIWLLFAVIFNIFLSLFPLGSDVAKISIVAVTNALFFAGAEYLRYTHGLFKEVYFKSILYFAVLSILTPAAIGFVFGGDRYSFNFVLFTFLSFGGLFYLLMTKQMITIIGLNIVAVAIVLLCSVYHFFLNSPSEVMLLASSFTTCAVFGLAGYAVYRANKYIKSGAAAEEEEVIK